MLRKLAQISRMSDDSTEALRKTTSDRMLLRET